MSAEAWKSLHHLGKTQFSPLAIIQSVNIPCTDSGTQVQIPQDISALLARSLASKPPPQPLLTQVVEELGNFVDVAYNSSLLACALPQPAFFVWAVDETSTCLDPRPLGDVVLPMDALNKLLETIFQTSEAGVCLPGLVEVCSVETLNKLDLTTVYKVHGNLLGSLIMVAIASRRHVSLDHLLPASSRPAVAVLQRKLRHLVSPNVSATKGPLGWLSIFGDFFGGGVGGGGASAGSGGLRILALDGGGTRALVTTTILRRLCGESAVHELFDVIVGTSAGGLLAIGLGCMKMSIEEAERVIKEVGEEVFAVGNNASTLQSASRFYFYGERHSSKELERKLHKIYGDMTMLDLTVVNESSCKVAAVSTLSSETSPAKPFLFTNYLSSGSRYLGDWKYSATLAAMATTAAPTYFRPVISKTRDGSMAQFQDGAMLANNPAHVALHEAVKIFPGREVAVLVSIGTGRSPWEKGSFSTNKASILHSITRDLNTLIYSATSTEAVADILTDMLDKTKFFRFQPELDRIVELDEARPEILERIVVTTNEYLDGNKIKIESLRKLLLNNATKFKPFSKL
jgi:predicted acylesterase/phospholipase RssA